MYPEQRENDDMSKPLNIGLIGFGNIGTGVVRTLVFNKELHDARLPRPMVLKRIVDRDTTTHRNAPYDPKILTDKVDEIFEDPEIDVVIELVGGEEPARTFVERALKAGKHVVTANKALLALHGPELIALASEKGVGLLYEAAVGGGIPIIRTLQQGLSANAFTSVQGILNGTCNYILSRMADEGIAFNDVLRVAQEKGYAEPDPTYDIEGYDTAHKTAILASLAFGMDIRFDDVFVEGITKIQPVDFKYAKELGYAIKLLGIAKRDTHNGAVEVRVHPTLVPLHSPLGQVAGVYNSVLVEGEPIGPTMYYGQGAGPAATSSAVVSDLMALAADEAGFSRYRDNRLGVTVGEKKIKPIGEMSTNYYIRFTMLDRPGVMATLGKALADQNVSIESMIQHRGTEIDFMAGEQDYGEPETDRSDFRAVDGDWRESKATISIVTHEAVEKNVQEAIRLIEADALCGGHTFVLRVEE